MNRTSIVGGLVAVAAALAPAGHAADEPCRGPAYDLAQRFVGVWKEYTVTETGEELAGTLRAEMTVRGCAFSQRFSSADGGLELVSLGYVEASSGRWRETVVLSNGRVATYEWREVGDAVIMERQGGNPQDLRRLKVTKLTAQSYVVAEEQSRDGGQTWTHVQLTRTRREP